MGREVKRRGKIVATFDSVNKKILGKKLEKGRVSKKLKEEENYGDI